MVLQPEEKENMDKEYSFVATMYREADDYEFGIQVKVKRSEQLLNHLPLWAVAAKKASDEALKLEAVIMSIERFTM